MADREFSAGGIVIKRYGGNIKVLLIKDSYGRWTWPKGKIDKGESVAEAAIREVREETGLRSVEAIKQIDRTQYFYRRSGKLIFKTVYIFLFRLLKNEGLRIQTEEIRAGKWFSPREALGRVDYKGSKKILKKAVDLFKKACTPAGREENNGKGKG